MKKYILIILLILGFILPAKEVELKSYEKEASLDVFTKLSKILFRCHVIRTVKYELLNIGPMASIRMNFEKDGPFTQDEIRTFILQAMRELQTDFGNKQELKDGFQSKYIDTKNINLSLKIIPPKWIHTFLLSVKRSACLSKFGKVELSDGQIKYYSRSKLPFLRKLICVETIEQAYEDLTGSKWVLSEGCLVPFFPLRNSLLIEAIIGKTEFEVKKKYDVKLTAYSMKCPKDIEFIHPHFDIGKKMTEKEGRLLMLGCLNTLMNEIRHYEEIQTRLAKGFNENNIEIELFICPKDAETKHPELHKVHLKEGQCEYLSLRHNTLVCLNTLKKESLQEALSLVEDEKSRVEIHH